MFKFSSSLQKLSRFTGAFLVFAYGFCLINGIVFLDLEMTESGGLLQFIGNNIPIKNQTANEILSMYTEAELNAREIIPEKLRDWLTEISDKISELKPKSER